MTSQFVVIDFIKVSELLGTVGQIGVQTTRVHSRSGADELKIGFAFATRTVMVTTLPEERAVVAARIAGDTDTSENQELEAATPSNRA